MAYLNRRYINLHEIQEILEQNEILSEENKQLKEQNTELWMFVEHCKKALTNYKKQGEQLGK